MELSEDLPCDMYTSILSFWAIHAENGICAHPHLFSISASGLNPLQIVSPIPPN